MTYINQPNSKMLDVNSLVGWFNGKLYEVIIFKRNITYNEDLKLKNYLNNKYKIW